jgi:predicted NUDIX family phosphoesterase
MKRSSAGKKKDENVLVFETRLFQEIGHFQGLNASVQPYLSAIFTPGNCFFMPRSVAEQDVRYKQVIPYVILAYNDSVFSYVRGRSSTEGRLVGLRSIGIGGHISDRDAALPGLEVHDEAKVGGLHRLYIDAVRREAEEEVSIDCEYEAREVAVLNDDQEEVGRVHFGIVHVFRLQAPRVFKRERLVSEAGFMSKAELAASIAEFEGWSQICIRAISDGTLTL